MWPHPPYEAIVIGSSAGGFQALTAILAGIQAGFPVPIIIVQHRLKNENDLLETTLQSRCLLEVKQADEKEVIEKSRIYTAPAGYHLLVEQDHSFSLNCEPPVGFSRPSIDVLFETASMAYKDRLAAIILTGANADGAEGIKKVRKQGGTTIAQNPATAEHPFMPQAAIDTGAVQFVLDLPGINNFLRTLDHPV